MVAFHNVVRGELAIRGQYFADDSLEMDMVERYACTVKVAPSNLSYHSIIREATAKSKDGRISQPDFLYHASTSARYSLFTPMEASIIFHFAGRGGEEKRLSLLDFARLLDPRWKAPHEEVETKAVSTGASLLNSFLQSAYNFLQGGCGLVPSNSSYSPVVRHCRCTWSNHRVPY